MAACVIRTRKVATPGAKKMSASRIDSKVSDRHMIVSSLERFPRQGLKQGASQNAATAESSDRREHTINISAHMHTRRS